MTMIDNLSLLVAEIQLLKKLNTMAARPDESPKHATSLDFAPNFSLFLRIIKPSYKDYLRREVFVQKQFLSEHHFLIHHGVYTKNPLLW
jgi:hypothetical protein